MDREARRLQKDALFGVSGIIVALARRVGNKPGRHDDRHIPVPLARRVVGDAAASEIVTDVLLTRNIVMNFSHADRLTEADEFSGWGGAGNILTFLAELTALARKAQEEDKRVFIWVCL